MSVITDGGGGGSTSNICAISPSDMAGNIDNILTRLETVENILSQILGYDITANRLSDITDVLGWINNVTYMGTTGWTLTPAGTLIPPPGWTFLGSGLTLSDGNTYSAVLMDSDGVLQYGFTTEGQVTGNAAVGSAYGIWSSQNGYGGTNADPDQIYFKGVTRLNQEFSTATSSSIIQRTETWRVDSGGLYLVTMSGASKLSGNDVGIMATLRMGVVATNDDSNQLSHEFYDFRDYLLMGNGYVMTGSFTVPWRANAGDEIVFSFTHGRSTMVGNVSTFHAIGEHVILVKVGSLT